MSAHRLRSRPDPATAFAHEIRGPLTIVIGYLETLARRPDVYGEHERAEMITQALVAARRIHAIADRMRLDGDGLDRRDGNGDGDGDTAPVSVREAVIAAAAIVDLRGRRIEFLRGAHHRLAADPWQFERVLTNLLSNAARHSPPGEPIEVYADAAEDEVVVVVADRGPGVAAEERDSIFEPLRQGSSGPHGASGLGLAIARRAVQDMGGRIWVEERPHGGAQFMFTAPAATHPEHAHTGPRS